MTRLRLFHSQHFDLVRESDLGERESLGVFTVLTANGEEQRHKVVVQDESGYSETTLADDYDATPMALTHLVQTYQDRHSDGITGVAGDDPKLTARVAALLGVPVVEGGLE